MALMFFADVADKAKAPFKKAKRDGWKPDYGGEMTADGRAHEASWMQRYSRSRKSQAEWTTSAADTE